MRNNKGFSLIETALVMLVLSATVFAFINIINIQVQKTALKNYSKDLTNTYQTFLDAFIKYVQKVNPTTNTTYTCTTIKADPDKFLPDSFSCIDNLGQSLEGRVSFKGTSVYGYFVYGNPGGANVSNYLNAFGIKTFTQLINLFIQMTEDLDNTSKKFLVIQNKTNIYQINSTNYVTATTSDIFGNDTYLSSLPTFNFAGQQYTVGLWISAQKINQNSSSTDDEDYPVTSCADVRNLPPYIGIYYGDAATGNSETICGNYSGYPLCCSIDKYTNRFRVYYFSVYSGYKYKITYTVPKNISYSTTFNFNGKTTKEITVVAIGAGADGDMNNYYGGGAGGYSLKKCIGVFNSITINFTQYSNVRVTIPGCATITAYYSNACSGASATGGDLNYTGGNACCLGCGGGGIVEGSTNRSVGGRSFWGYGGFGIGGNGYYHGSCAVYQSCDVDSKFGIGGGGGGGNCCSGRMGKGGPAQVTILYNVQ